jgi:hypothetical protein
VLIIGTEPRVSNLTSAPLCSSYDAHTPYYHDTLALGDEPPPLPGIPEGEEPSAALAVRRCTTVAGLIWDQRKAPAIDSPSLAHEAGDGRRGAILGGGRGGYLWKLLTGDVEQDVYTGPHFPNSSTDFVSAKFVRHCQDGCLFDLEVSLLGHTKHKCTGPNIHILAPNSSTDFVSAKFVRHCQDGCLFDLKVSSLGPKVTPKKPCNVPVAPHPTLTPTLPRAPDTGRPPRVSRHRLQASDHTRPHACHARGCPGHS